MPKGKGFRGVETVLGSVDGLKRFVDIAPVVEQKLRAIRCHQSQMNQFAYDRAALGLAQFRGALAGRCEFAEVYCGLQRSP